MKKEEEIGILVVGLIAAPGAEQGCCAKCNAIVWPTSGSLELAVRKKIKMICINCARKMELGTFGGIMEHGKMWSRADYERNKKALSITCPQCGMTSWNTNDVRVRYCGNCHQFHDEMRS